MCACAWRVSVLTLVVAGAALALAAGDVVTLRCPTDVTMHQCFKLSSDRFKVEGGQLGFEYKDDDFLKLECSPRLQLDSVRTFLPQFTPALQVGHITFSDCPPAHYATVLAALNVTLTSPFDLKLNDMRKKLTAASFTDLPPLLRLTLNHAGTLRGLPTSLEVLTVKDMNLSNKVLKALPSTLTELRLERVNVDRVPAVVLDLPELRSLYVVNESPRTAVTVERGNASRLQRLYVAGADAALMSEWAPPALEEVTLQYWQAKRPNPIPACDKLVKLSLLTPDVHQFPSGWVARCPRLENLHITGAFKVSELPARLLENATQLTSFGIHSTEISSLPAQLFEDTPNLTHLKLFYNHIKELQPQLLATTSHLTHLDLELNSLTELPQQIFAGTPHLTHLDLGNNNLAQLPSSMLSLPLVSLDLGYNRLNTSVVAELARFPELRNLTLSGNYELGDVCEVNENNVPGKSPLATLSKLERLKLYGTSISIICRDWREDMVNLKYLELSDAKLGNLTYEDLQYRRNVPAEVELPGTIYFTADDYDRVAAAAAVSPPSRGVTVILNMKFNDEQRCRLYWLKKALNAGLLPLDDVVVADFTDKLWLNNIRAESLLCPSKETCASVPTGCYCGMAGGGMLRVVCVGVKLDHVPRLPSLDNNTDVHAVDLVLSDNSITELVADDLPPHLRVLDLRNNSISYMTEATARALVSVPKRRVLLAGNPLECSCRATPALRVLRDHAAALVGYDSLRCEDGGTLEDAIHACSTPALI